MTRRDWLSMVCSLAVIVPGLAEQVARATETPQSFDGPWHTSIGTVTLKHVGTQVTGSYGNEGEFSLQGTVDDERLTFEYEEGKARGDASWTIARSGNSFHGTFKIRGGRAGEWNGWRPDPAALKGQIKELGELWLTSLGLMELKQAGDQVKGRCALGGTAKIEGAITGRRLDFTYHGFRSGKGWFDLSPDGATFAGAAATSGFSGWFGWQGRSSPEFVRHAKLVPGKVVDGSTTGLLTYAVRAPERYQEGDDKKWPAIVILHGSNMNGEAYVNTIADAWPDIAQDYLLIGINGERPSNIEGSGQFNYTYINYVGRSTFKGFPGTDRESPALVAEALDDLRAAYPISHYFVGGHSQGGFLTFSLLMNFPEKLAGTFAVSAGLIFQCEPSAYRDEELRAAQRSVPLAIVHGKNDRAVDFGSGEYAAVAFGEAGWPAFRFFADESGAGHMFAGLPVGEAIRWLEALASGDPPRLMDFAEERMKSAGGERDAIAALNRARKLMPATADGAARARLAQLSGDLDARAAAGAEEFLPKIRNEQKQGTSWIDEFLVYRDAFEFAPAASETMQAFNELRVAQEPGSQKIVAAARSAFQQGRADEGYVKYQEIVENYYAATPYRNVKRWLVERK